VSAKLPELTDKQIDLLVKGTHTLLRLRSGMVRHDFLTVLAQLVALWGFETMPEEVSKETAIRMFAEIMSDVWPSATAPEPNETRG
jgi:hypothetical protein